MGKHGAGRNPARTAGAALAVIAAATAAGAQATRDAPIGQGLSFYGLPGLIDMPNARSLPDAELTTTLSYMRNALRGTLAFQITPRLTGSFRYSYQGAALGPGTFNLDRGIDLHYRLLNERRWLPALAVGVRDFGGTGWYSGEYVVATKSLGERVELTGGIGWGRLGSAHSFDNPLGVFSDRFNTRPDPSRLGGTFNFSQFFRGPAAVFFGAQWRATDRLTLKAEVSSDAYTRETASGALDLRSALNFGAQYEVKPGFTLGGYYLYGSEVGVSASFALNPNRPPNAGDFGPAPMPVLVRTLPQSMWPSVSVVDAPRLAQLQGSLTEAFAAEGMLLQGLALEGSRARVELENTRFDAAPQAIGRAARILSRYLPPAVTTFEIVPMVQGMAAAQITLQRVDVERLEHAPDGAAQILAAARIEGASPHSDAVSAQDFANPPARLSWGVAPYLALALFDPDNPVRADVGLRGTLGYRLAPGLVVSGAARLKLAGNLDSATRLSNSVLPHVRTDSVLYDKTGSGLEYLTLEYFTHPARDLYGRVTLGYLEQMYGGVSAELLWKPVSSRLAFGAELNYVRQRDFDKLFGFRDYSVATGHVSAYYDFGNGFEGQLDVGRYLAGDYGATVSLDRTFDNGWEIGAFATFTDVSAADFGEGSFDKGIRLTIPMSWFSGTPTRERIGSVVRPIQRDGGARLDVRNRLYGLVRDSHDPVLTAQWGRFWR